MHQAKLCGVLKELGFSDVAGVISSGNVVFSSDLTDTAALEAQLEKAWPAKLGFSSTTIIRSQQQLQNLVDKDPYEGLAHSQKSYLLVTFFKHPPKLAFKLPYQPLGRDYKLLKMIDKTLFSALDVSATAHSPDLMSWLERQFGKEITSRTWLTVQRILKKME
jgi:uncharacterized protein (DUF1697 family)